MNSQIITQSNLKKILHYNPDDGFFTWKININKVKVGDLAGYTNKRNYIRIRAEGRRYMAHRLAWLYMKGEWPRNEIDHIDHVRSNNKWNNLREATHQENSKNQKLHKTNTSGFTGVCWDKGRSEWIAQIMLN